jgi:hypothetical protein
MSTPYEISKYESIVLLMTDEVAEVMKQRSISDMEIKLVIHHGENTGEKLYQPGDGRILAKMPLFGATYYVEYNPSEGGYRVHTAYLHRSEIKENK